MGHAWVTEDGVPYVITILETGTRVKLVDQIVLPYFDVTYFCFIVWSFKNNEFWQKTEWCLLRR